MKICKILKKKDVGSTGIGAMIVFIATVLVAGIAASVFIQTSMRLESQAMTTGQKTIKEVASGVAVFGVQGFVAGGYITKMTITVRPRAGAPDVDLNETFIELSNTAKKMILDYKGIVATSWYDSTTGVDNVFNLACFPATADRYGICVLEDADSSVNLTNPTLNKGDKVFLCVSTVTCFAPGIPVRTDIWGAVVPEEGSPGVISFTSPSSFGQDTVFDLQ